MTARAPDAQPRRVLLVGMMGAGKTTVGRLLATRLGWGYADSDEEVEAFTGRTVKEIFESGGEAAFRPLETRALVAAVAGCDGPAVISVAGGAVIDPANRALLRRSGTVVWLRAKPATLSLRVAPGAAGGGAPGASGGSGASGASAAEADHRPLLGDDPAGTLARLDAERRALYDEVADVIVDVDALEPGEVVDRIAEALKR